MALLIAFTVWTPSGLMGKTTLTQPPLICLGRVRNYGVSAPHRLSNVNDHSQLLQWLNEGTLSHMLPEFAPYH